ncbi:MAG TPA: extracellular solute-binding protein [Herpetosiphonaceae bacterium]|nr:extracellular solute-binding protein [Herpetosiphonaceae bacterium]
MATDDQRNNGKQVSRRAFLRTMAAAIGAGTLAACGGSSSGGQPAAGGDAGAGAGAGTGQTIELSPWYHQYGEEGTQQAAMRYAAEYSKVKPNVKINMSWTPGDYGAKLNAALLGGEGPDIFESSLNLDMVKAGQVVALDDIFGDAKADFSEVGLRANTVEGKIYGVKMIDDMGMIYYRKSMLDKTGVKPPTTLDELGAAIQKLNSGQTKGFFMGNDGGVGVMADAILWSAGHDHLKDGKPDFNNDDVVSAFQRAQQFLKDNSGGILSGAPTDWWDPTAFTSGLAAMQWTGLWAMPGIKKALADDFGVLPWPQIEAGKGKPATFWGGWTQFVNAKSKNVEEAKAFVKWLWIDSKEFQKDWSLSYGFHVPPRKSAAAEAEPLKTGPAKEAVDILAQYGHPNDPAWTGAMGTAYSDAVTNILTKGADPKAELDTAATKVQAELDKQA